MTPPPTERTQGHDSLVVQLRDLTDSPELTALDSLYIASPLLPVRDLVLITDIEEITAVGPDTVIVLTPEASSGAWMISAALRYAWERRACALVVPENTSTETVVELARRLGVSLLTSRGEMVPLSLKLAMQLGVARAGLITRLQNFTARIAGATGMAMLLARTSEELNDATVWMESAGTTVGRSSGSTSAFSDASESDAEEAHHARVEVVLSRQGAQLEKLVAIVPTHLSHFAFQILSATLSVARALLAESRLADLHASLPVISIASLVSAAHLESFEAPVAHEALAELDGRLGEAFRAVCFLSNEHERIGSSLHYLWSSEVGDVPLAHFADGWLAFVPVDAGSDFSPTVDRMRSRLETHHQLRLQVGVSAEHRGMGSVQQGLREAWIAARMADNEGSGALLEFEAVAPRLISRVIPAELARQLFQMMYPKFFAQPNSGELAATALAYLDTNGSVAQAAQHLGVHRNTVKSRLQKCIELGCNFEEPHVLLSMHMLLAAVYGVVRSGKDRETR